MGKIGFREDDMDVASESNDGRSQFGGSTASAATSRKQTFAIWLKLGLMILLPILCLLCFSATLVATEMDVAANAANVQDLMSVVKQIHTLNKNLLAERGLNSVYLASDHKKDDLVVSRGNVDNSTIDFNNYVSGVLGTIQEDLVLQLSALEGMLKGLPAERLLVDAGSVTVQQAEKYYSTIIVYGNKIISSLIQQLKTQETATKLAVTVNLIHAEDDTGKMRESMTLELAQLTVTAQGQQLLDKIRSIRNDGITFAYETAPAYIGKEIMKQRAGKVETEVAKKARELVIEIQTLSPTPATVDEYIIDVWYDVLADCAAELSDLVDMIVKDMQDTASSNHSAALLREALAIVLVVLCVALALGLAFLTAASVAKPFKRLAKVKSALTAEVNLLSLNNDAFSRFVPFDMLPILNVADVTELRIGHSASSRVSMLVGDIVDFAVMSAQYGPDEVFKMLNAWLQGIIPICKKHQAIVDKFVGDGVVAYFHRPVECVNAGIAISHWAAEVNVQRTQTGGYSLAFGLGSNTGELSLGTVALGSRVDTISMSDAMDLTNLVEHATRDYKAQFLATSNTIHAVGKQEISSRQLGTVSSIKHANVPVFEVLDAIYDDVERQGKIDTEEYFSAAMNEYQEGHYAEAKNHLETCLRRCPKDGAATHYNQLMKSLMADQA